MLADLSLLTERRFALLFSARTVSMLGTAMAPVALAFAVLDLPGASVTTLGLVLGAQVVAEVLFFLIGGVVADRFPRHRVMVGAELVAGLSFGVLALLFLTGSARLPVVMALAAVNGIGTALFWPALLGIVPQVVPVERLQPANGLLRLSINGARIVGLAVGGGLVAVVGPGWALAADAATFMVSAALLAGIRVPATRGVTGGTLLADLRGGWGEFVSRQWVWVVVLQFSLVNAAVMAGLGVFGPVVAQRELGGAAAWSTVLTAKALGTVLGVLVALRVRPGRPILVAVLVTFPVATPLLLLSGPAPLWVLAVAAFGVGVCYDVFGVLWETALQREVPAEALSRVGSYDMLGSLLLGPLAMLVAGPVAGVVGVRAALLWCAALVAVPTALALLSPQVRQLRSPATGTAHTAPSA